MQIQQTTIPTQEQSPVLQNKESQTGGLAKVAPKNPALEKGAELSSPKDAEPSSYLKVLSRLENMIQKDELPEKALGEFMKAVRVRLEEGSGHDKKMVLYTPEAKTLQITKTEELAAKIQEALQNKEQLQKALALLKQPRFVALMNGKEQPTSAVYGPDGKTTAMAPKNTPEISMPASRTSGAVVSPEQAIATLKSMQTSAKGADTTPAKSPITAA